MLTWNYTQNWESKGSFDPKNRRKRPKNTTKLAKTAQKSTPHARRRLKMSALKSAREVPTSGQVGIPLAVHQTTKTDTKRSQKRQNLDAKIRQKRHAARPAHRGGCPWDRPGGVPGPSGKKRPAPEPRISAKKLFKTRKRVPKFTSGQRSQTKFWSRRRQTKPVNSTRRF